ncbi:hypothetical protein TWF730_001600 [Orbilia blumenaviensis]|uniref:F-box domain-containing protein n=1 Tax=Orbilia blumenaviensis TaxID=1796055 RepID=A0AAV9UJ37_9PEZI
MNQTSMLTIPPELHISIFAFLGLGDLSRLVQTSKYFHRTAGHYLRRRIDLQTTDAIWKFQHGTPPETVPIERATFIQDDFFDYRFAFGMDYFVMDEGAAEGGEEVGMSVDKMNTFLDMILKGTGPEGRGVSIRGGELYLSKPVIEDNQFYSIFRALRDFSYSRPASEFSITSLTGQFNPNRVTRLFDTHKLTKLSISFQQVEWNHRAEKSDPSAQTLCDIIALKELFLRSPNLEILTLNPVMEIIDFRPLPENVMALDELTEAFMSLKKLHTLDVRVYLFHPSYFVPVPEAVRTLSFYHVNLYSKIWWMKFAKFPFKGVETMEVYPSEEEFGYIFARDDYQVTMDRDGTERTPEEIDAKGFRLGDVGVRGLKSFKFEETEKLFLPRDLTLCVLRRNEGLRADVKQALVRQSGLLGNDMGDEGGVGGRRRSF